MFTSIFSKRIKAISCFFYLFKYKFSIFKYFIFIRKITI